MIPTTNPNDAPPFTPDMIEKLLEVTKWRRPEGFRGEPTIVRVRVGRFGGKWQHYRQNYKWFVTYEQHGEPHEVDYSTHYLVARIVEPEPAREPRQRPRIRGARPNY